MNNYPESTDDYDKKFLRVLLSELFSKKDLKHCGQKNTIKHFNRPTLKFAKGDFDLTFVYIVPQHFIIAPLLNNDCSFYFLPSIDIYELRTKEDKRRYDAFRSLAIEIGNEI